MMLSAHGDTLSIQTLEQYVRQTNQILPMFNENKTKQLLLVRESKRYASHKRLGRISHLNICYCSHC